MNSSSDDKFDNDKEMVSPNFTPRRAARNRTKPKKYDEYLDMTPIKRETNYFVESSDEEVSQESALKSKALFGNDDVDGNDIFKFKSRHTKNDLQNKVKAAVIKSINSPMKTPKKHILLKGDEATPRHVVDIMKKKIIQAVDNDSSESDFSGSSSDFVPDKSIEESESSDVNSNPGSEDENEQQIPTQITASKYKVKQKHSEYFVTPDNYFMMNSSKKVKGKPLTKDETRTLVNLIANSPIITTKATNASNNMLKNEEWVRLAQKFNATAIFPRNPQQLRLKWENLKKNSRKRSTKIRMNQIKTGGGPPEYIPPDDILEQVESLLRSTSGKRGFAVPFRGDGELKRQSPSGDVCSTSTDEYTTVYVVDSEKLPLETPQQTQDLGTLQAKKLKRLTTSGTPRAVIKKKIDGRRAEPSVIKKKFDGHRAARNLAIAEYFTAKKQLIEIQKEHLKIKNKKMLLEIKKLKKNV